VENKLLKPVLSLTLIMLFSLLIISGSLFAQGDNPFIDGVPSEWVPANYHADSELDVITINGFDDFNLGVDFAEITLHVGLGNFRSVDVEDLTKHKVDSERIKITDDCVSIVNNAKDNKYRICAVGTTVVRTVESSVSTDGYLKPFDGWTNKFIFPPYDFKVPDMMISNFHLPYSTLLMMVSAFAGYDLLFEAYKIAVKEKYRFGTYGDAMLIL